MMSKTLIVLLVVAATTAERTPKAVCGRLCDGDSASQARNPRVTHTDGIFSREVSLHVSDEDNVGFASISNGDAGDEVWMDRSFNGGQTWEGRVGNTAIPSGARSVQTPVFNVDGNVAAEQVGILRACGKAGNRDEIACTPWFRTTALASFPAQAALTTMMMYYKNSDGKFSGMGWWNNANALTGLIDYIKVTGDRTFQFVIDTTYEKNKNAFEGNFCNEFLDDTGWWGLAWVDAYDLTGNQKYLQTAERTAECMQKYIDGTCGGGVFWSNARNYKNAITNELFIKLAAALHNRINGDTKYLDWATQIWRWFDASGMINNGNLINDGLNTEGDCKNNNGITWTYNQGVILGALVQLNKATGDGNYLNRARTLANAATSSTYLNHNGVLHEPCDHDAIDCGGDAQTFKGVFARNLGELNEALSDHPYSNYIRNNGETIGRNGNTYNQFGLHYEGPFEFFSTATQQSAFEMLVAHERVNRS